MSWESIAKADPYSQLLDQSLGREGAKIETAAGLFVMAFGLLLPLLIFSNPWRRVDVDWWPPVAGLALVALGGYLALAGHRSHLYRRHNRNTVTLMNELWRNPNATESEFNVMTEIHIQRPALAVDIRQILAKIEVMLGLVGMGIGLLHPVYIFWDPLRSELQLWPMATGPALFTVGGCLALAGHGSHVYYWSNRNTVALIEEIRRRNHWRDAPNEHISR